MESQEVKKQIAYDTVSSNVYLLQIRTQELNKTIESINKIIDQSSIEDMFMFMDDNQVSKQHLHSSLSDMIFSKFDTIERIKELCNDVNSRHKIYFEPKTNSLAYFYGGSTLPRSFGFKNLDQEFIDNLFKFFKKFIQDFYAESDLTSFKFFGVELKFNDIVLYCRLKSHRKYLITLIKSLGDGAYKPHIDILMKSINRNLLHSKLKFIDTVNGEIVEFAYDDYKDYCKLHDYFMPYAYNTKDNTIKFLGE